MTTYSTGNALGSTDPRDLYDNAENLDNLTNGSDPAYDDRLGNSRKSWAGMESEFDQRLTELGYQELGAYEDGPYTITQLNQVISRDGFIYRLSASVGVPYTTQGTSQTSWDSEKVNFVQIDFVTAQQLEDERTQRQSADSNLQDQISGGSPLEASAFSEISWHGQVVENSVTIPDNVNAWSFGPTMAIAAGQSVTIGSGSFWTIANGDVNQ